MDRNELEKIVSKSNIDLLEKENCDFTNRVTNNKTIEFITSLKCCDLNGDDCIIQAYYYVDQDWVDSLGEDVDWLALSSWEIDHYEII